MQINFHYYATYFAAFLAGYSHDESLTIAYFDEFTDCCTETLLKKLHAPLESVSSQYVSEMAGDSSDIIGMQRIARIWSAFHFLPYDLYADKKGCSKSYMNRYRLICKPNGKLVADTVDLAKGLGSLEAAGMAVHIVADTWAHSNFAGVPSNVINDVDSEFVEKIKDGDGFIERKMNFIVGLPKDNPEKSRYSCSLSQDSEGSVMNLGHGRIGHIADYSFMRFRYLPAWNNYEYLYKDNPEDFYKAFTQKVYILKFLRGEYDTFELDTYDESSVSPWKEDIKNILEIRRPDTCPEWKELCTRISGHDIEDFDIDKYQKEYLDATSTESVETYLGRFFMATAKQKGMVTHRIFESGNLLAGISRDVSEMFKGITDIKEFIIKLAGVNNHD